MKPLATLLTIAVILSHQTSPAQAGRRIRAEEQARQQVEHILQQETEGKLTDREQTLKELIVAGHAPDEAYWQAGYVKRGDEWVSLKNSWLTPEQEQKLVDYTQARDDSDDSDEGRYELARWCARHGFDDQADAHLKAVLLNNPDHSGLRKMLGYRRIGNQWMNQDEYKSAVREANRLAKELREWSPKVARIRRDLHSSDPHRTNKARVQLKGITEVAAVPALELILLPSSEIGAEACVDQLREIDHRRSSIALCKAALFLPLTASVARQATIEELKTRPLKDFVPALLDQLSTSMTTRYRLFAQRDYAGHAHFLLQLVGESESRLSRDFLVKNQILVANMSVGFDGAPQLWVTSGGRPEPGSNRGYPRLVTWGELQENVRSLQSRSELRRSEEQLRVVQSARLRRNRAIGDLLREVTGISNLYSPEDWWNWWNSQNEYSIQNKPQRIQGLTEVAAFEVATPREVVESHSCFVAGTPVWTDRGPQPIEELKIGDMALTKDIETGELAYRPIIRTTVRQPKELVTIDFGAERITATKGHPFWVSGEGWVKACDLQQGQSIHTPTGVIKVAGVSSANKAEVYNLIVDGFHTYFVGLSQALCHDISMAPPTDAIVPGLLNR